MNMNVRPAIAEAMRRVDEDEQRSFETKAEREARIEARAIEREIDPRELDAALADAIDAVALALIDRAKAVCVARISRRT
jgi:hypothetical protein